MPNDLEDFFSPGSLKELHERLGFVPLWRIRARPAPGTATEEDLVAAEREPCKRFCELIDGVLIDKVGGARQSVYAAKIGSEILNFIDSDHSGIVVGIGAALRLAPGRVRRPDICYISWDRIPGGAVPDDDVAELLPNLAVEVVGPDETRREIELKMQDYFQSGTEVFWIVDAPTETAEIVTSSGTRRVISGDECLDGGTALPGLKIPLFEVFAAIHC